MSELTKTQVEVLRKIEAGLEDDCTVMLPAGMIQLAGDGAGKYVWPPKIMLTDRGREALREAENA